jgi:hypothetical protein
MLKTNRIILMALCALGAGVIVGTNLIGCQTSADDDDSAVADDDDSAG